MSRVVITVRGGVVQTVHSDDPETEIVLFDFDNIGEDEPSEEGYRIETGGLYEVL